MAGGAGVRYEDLVIGNASEELEQFAGISADADRIGARSGTGARTEVAARSPALPRPAPATTMSCSATTKTRPPVGPIWPMSSRPSPTDEPAFVAFTYAGYLLHQGVNSAGLGSVGNALYARDAHPGIPKLLLYRRALAQTTIEGAIRAATDANRAFGNNHLFATADGDIIDVEVSGAGWDMLHAGNRFLVHANHFVSPSMQPLDAGEDLLNSRLRQAQGGAPDRRRLGHRSMSEAMKSIFSDHANYPKSVCKHHAPESDLGLRHDRLRGHRRHGQDAPRLRRQPLSRRVAHGRPVTT